MIKKYQANYAKNVRYFAPTATCVLECILSPAQHIKRNSSIPKQRPLKPRGNGEREGKSATNTLRAHKLYFM